MAIATSTTHTQLSKYRAKRDFSKTAEPAGNEARRTAAAHSYLIQKHAASRLHYDFRLELDGVLKSWAVTRGPSLNPTDKRLAVHVEDHPLDYGSFEGTIPQGQYGGGTVMLWDIGTWEPSGDPRRDFARGNLTFNLNGKRLKGRWHLVRLGGKRSGDSRRDNWLLIKGRDEYADPDGDAALEKYQASVVSRRSMEGIAKAAGRSWGRSGSRQKSAAEAAEASKALRKKERAGAVRRKRKSTASAASPVAFVPPQLATLVSAPPRGEDWVHEIKFDGYRLLALLEQGRVRFYTRAGNDWSARFLPLCKALAKLNVQDALIDGEAVIAAADGTFSFHSLQEALSTGNLRGLRYYAFDLLHLDGVDLRAQPLNERKALLERLLRKAPPVLQYSRHFTESGERLLTQACHMALEGIVSKQGNAPYHSGRTSSWLKSKCIKEQEFVIGGYTEQPKHPDALGALLVGYYDADDLRFAGKVGTGFSAAEGRALLQKLKKRTVKTTSFVSLPTAARRGARFVEPTLVAHVNFGEWTPDGKLRHPSFQGLREDKPAREVSREREASPAAKQRRR
ncbi:MAG TPA: non-homologous end-joining DNA ligase [Steroidobacteraceae bacterium]